MFHLPSSSRASEGVANSPARVCISIQGFVFGAQSSQEVGHMQGLLLGEDGGPSPFPSCTFSSVAALLFTEDCLHLIRDEHY